jgi:hypothetical protein
VSFSIRSFQALEVVEGDAQQGLVLSKLPVSPSVRLVDSTGKPRLGVPVTFIATKGGQVKTPTVSTGADGIASPGEWILGDEPGDQTLEVRVESAKLTLRAKATGTPIRYRPAQYAAGGYATCALGDDGLASCWGEQPKVGDGTDKNRPSPTLTKGDIKFTSLAAGPAHMCGVTADSTTYCWGLNVFLDTTANRLHTNVPTRIQGTVAWTQISPGIAHTCGLSKQAAYCWGDNAFGELAPRRSSGSLWRLSILHSRIGRISHLWPHHRRLGVLLGLQLEWPARRWHVDEPSGANGSFGRLELSIHWRR